MACSFIILFSFSYTRGSTLSRLLRQVEHFQMWNGKTHSKFDPKKTTSIPVRKIKNKLNYTEQKESIWSKHWWRYCLKLRVIYQYIPFSSAFGFQGYPRGTLRLFGAHFHHRFRLFHSASFFSFIRLYYASFFGRVFFSSFFFYWRQTFDGLYPQKILYIHDVLVVFGSLFSYCIYILHRYLAGYFFSLPFRLFFFNFSVVLWI